MPLYFFDIDDGHLRTRDGEGTECVDIHHARREAIAVLPDIARDVLPNGDQRNFIATVRDVSGQNVFRATLSLWAEWLVPPPSI